MRSVIYSQTGDPSVLRLVDRDMSEPGPGEVRVRVVVSGVNPTDWKLRRWLRRRCSAAVPGGNSEPRRCGCHRRSRGGGCGPRSGGSCLGISRRPPAADRHRAGIHEPARGPGRTTSRRHQFRHRCQPRRTGHDRTPRTDSVRGWTRAAASRCARRQGCAGRRRCGCGGPRRHPACALGRCHASSQPSPARPRRRSRRQPAPTMSSTTATRTQQPQSRKSLLTVSTWWSRSRPRPTRGSTSMWSSHAGPSPSTPTTAAASSRSTSDRT